MSVTKNVLRGEFSHVVVRTVRSLGKVAKRSTVALAVVVCVTFVLNFVKIELKLSLINPQPSKKGWHNFGLKFYKAFL
jgi:hypothetical protein